MAGARKPARSASLLKEPAVQELLGVMAAHNAPGREDMLSMLQQIAGLEKQLNAAVDELAAMRRELAEARESPVKRTLQKAVIVLQDHILALRDNLADLKAGFIEGCQKTLAAFKEQGVSALAHTAKFFHIRPALEAIGQELGKAIDHDERALSVIESASKEYHEAGRHLKNIMRAVQGREPVAEPKGPGALAHALEAPFKRERALFSSMKDRTEGAVKRLEHLEQAARPPIRQTMEELNAKIARARQGQEKPAPAVKRDER